MADDDPFAGYIPPDWPNWNTQPDDPVPPVDPLVRECFPELSKLYLEAARRLPIADIPYLACCLTERGLAIGLCDPVTSILLTTIYGFAHDKDDFPGLVLEASKEEALQQANDRLTFVDAVHRSCLGLIEFMQCYFRYLTYEEAKQCLAVAGHDLPLAVLLVEKSCGSSLGHPDPDSATTKEALRQAAMSAWDSDHKSLLRLMTSRYERDVLAPVLDVLRDTEQLTADWVYIICDLLLHPCSPSPPPPIPMLAPPRTFRDSNGQVTTTITIRNDLFPAPAVISQGPVSMAIIASSTRPTHGDDTVHLSTALAKQKVYDAADDDKLRSCASQISTWFLKMSLLETMHELYITALARLPMYALHQCHLIRAVLTAGYSYGPMHHPVANIMFNSIWYDALFPFLKDGHDEPPAADILDSRCMSRVESCSLDGIVALICKSNCVTPREALEQLCKDRRELDLWAHAFMFVQDNIDDVLLAAKHPQPAAYKAFIQGLTSADVNNMRGLMMMDQVISANDVNQLKEMITKIAAERGIAARVHRIPPALSQSTVETLFARRSAFKSQQDYVRGNLKQLMDDYSLREGQKYHVGVICGVATKSYRYYNGGPTCYHVNFLASMDIGVPNGATPTPMHKLFFAEFWNRSDERIKESTEPPICCVVDDCPKHFGRCIVCESSSSTIVHPPYCGYCIATTEGVFPAAESLVEADPGRMLDMDFVYFDAEKDNIESAKMISGQSSGSKNVRPR